jgi:hypothetical protein
MLFRDPYAPGQIDQLRAGLVGEELAKLNTLIGSAGAGIDLSPQGLQRAQQQRELINTAFAGQQFPQIEQSIGGLLNTQDYSTLPFEDRLKVAAWNSNNMLGDRTWQPTFQIPDVEALFSQYWGGELTPSRPVDLNSEVRGNEFNAQTLEKIKPLLLNPTPRDGNKNSFHAYNIWSPAAQIYQSKYADTPTLAAYHSEKNPMIDWKSVVETAFPNGGSAGPVNLGAARITGVDPNGKPIYAPWTRDDVTSWVWDILGSSEALSAIKSNSGEARDARRYISALDNLAKDIWAEQQQRTKQFDPTDLRSVVPLGTDKRYLDPYTFDPTQGNWADKWGTQLFMTMAAALAGYAGGQALAPLLSTAGSTAGGTAGGAVGGKAGGLAGQAVGPLTGGNIGTGAGAAVVGGGGGTALGSLGGTVGGTLAGQIPQITVTGTVGAGAGSTVGGALGGALGGLAGNTGPIKIPDQKPAIDKALEQGPSVKFPEKPWYSKAYDNLSNAYDVYNQVNSIGGMLSPQAVSGGAIQTGGGGGGSLAGGPLTYDPTLMTMILKNVQSQQQAARPRALPTQTEKVK